MRIISFFFTYILMKGFDYVRQVIPFKKELLLNTKINEVTSISLEHTLLLEDDNVIRGEIYE